MVPHRAHTDCVISHSDTTHESGRYNLTQIVSVNFRSLPLGKIPSLAHSVAIDQIANTSWAELATSVISILLNVVGFGMCREAAQKASEPFVIEFYVKLGFVEEAKELLRDELERYGICVEVS